MLRSMYTYNLLSFTYINVCFTQIDTRMDGYVTCTRIQHNSSHAYSFIYISGVVTVRGEIDEYI